MRLVAVAALVLSLGSSIAARAAQPTERVEIPIHQTRFPGGVVRYWIKLSVDGAPPIEAMLDTGSTGLHLLPGAQPHTAPSGRPSRASYGNGVILKGQTSPAQLTLDGQITLRADVDWTSQVECMEERPHCPAEGVPLADYRIGGGSRGGFQAILGVGMRRGAADNPLARTASGAWIVVLPALDDDRPGKLIVNATADDRARFPLLVKLQRQENGGDYWWDNATPACISYGSEKPICGSAMLDSGAPNLRFTYDKGPEHAAWPAGVRATLVFGAVDKPVLRQSFVVGDAPGSRVEFARRMKNAPWAGLNTGFLPFQGLAVFYDTRDGMIGLASRADFAP
ncbi:MAG: hypothetical protein J7515_14650 [Caulobacter sp.]|nr:hypothetical protein [Caulobacter sp.]